jgi:hypothetical protein
VQKLSQNLGFTRIYSITEAALTAAHSQVTQ